LFTIDHSEALLIDAQDIGLDHEGVDDFVAEGDEDTYAVLGAELTNGDLHTLLIFYATTSALLGD
jgi:hypothetical protein